MPMNPAFDLSGTMNRMTIYNQKNLLLVLFDQPSKKGNHHCSGESLREDHKGQATSVGNRRDHIAAKSLTGSWNNGRVSFEAITASGLMVRTQSHFVAPVDLSMFCAGLPANCRVVVFQPALDCLRVLLVGATQWFLRCKPPVLQIPTDRPDRNRNTVAFFDQLTDGIACPQDKGKLQLIGASVGNQTNNSCAA